MWMSADVRSTVVVLHREVETTIADADHGALEIGITLLSLPDVELAYPPDLAVPSAERIDAELVVEHGEACLVLVAQSGEG